MAAASSSRSAATVETRSSPLIADLSYIGAGAESTSTVSNSSPYRGVDLWWRGRAFPPDQPHEQDQRSNPYPHRSAAWGNLGLSKSCVWPTRRTRLPAKG